ncbi:MAG: DUF4339 domain-containing protein [Chlamydiales bacterium]|nr:DUF4339 domain-containing protein [Chlamydiales bacterium]
MQLFNLLLFWVFFGCIASYLAKRRGRNPLAWFFLGLFLGILGVLLVVILPNRLHRLRVPPSLPRPQRSEAWLKMWYYLDPAHSQQGPLEFPDLAKHLRENRLTESSLVWGEGMKEWKPLAEMPDLIQEMNKA